MYNLDKILEDIKSNIEKKQELLAEMIKKEVESVHDYIVNIQKDEKGNIIVSPSDEKKAMEQEFNQGKYIWTILKSRLNK